MVYFLLFLFFFTFCLVHLLLTCIILCKLAALPFIIIITQFLYIYLRVGFLSLSIYLSLCSCCCFFSIRHSRECFGGRQVNSVHNVCATLVRDRINCAKTFVIINESRVWGALRSDSNVLCCAVCCCFFSCAHYSMRIIELSWPIIFFFLLYCFQAQLNHSSTSLFSFRFHAGYEDVMINIGLHSHDLSTHTTATITQ